MVKQRCYWLESLHAKTIGAAGKNCQARGWSSLTPALLGEGWGEGLSANCNHNVAAGFSPQAVHASFISVEETDR